MEAHFHIKLTWQVCRPYFFFLNKPSVLISYAGQRINSWELGRQIRIQDNFFSLIESINLGDDLRISYIFHRLILSTSSFKKWTLRKIRPSIDTTMDQQKSLHHH